MFAFTMNVAPALIRDCMREAGWQPTEVDLFAIHQANKQILEMVVSKAVIPLERTPTDVFSKYANSSTNSVMTVICDQPKNKCLDKAILCTFGIGLSWGGAALSLAGIYNGGISFYQEQAYKLSRDKLIEHIVSAFQKGT